MNSLIPFVTSQLEIVKYQDYYCIGKLKGELYLLVEISLTAFANKNEFQKEIDVYQLYIKMLKMNNMLTMNSLYFYGLYLDKTLMKYYLVFEYPDYSISSFLMNPHNKDDNTFEGIRNKLVKQFLNFTSLLEDEYYKYLLLSKEFIFLSRKKELKLLYLGPLKGNRFTSDSSNYYSFFPQLKEKSGKIINYLNKEYALDYSDIPRFNEMKTELWAKFASYIYTNDFNAEKEIDDIYSITDISSLETNISIPITIKQLINDILNKDKSDSNISPLLSFNLLTDSMISDTSSVSSNSTIEDNDEMSLTISNRPLSEPLTYLNYKSEIGIVINLSDDTEDDLNNERERLLRFMIKYFPPQDTYDNCPNLYHTNPTKSFISGCMLPRELPKQEQKKNQTDRLKSIDNLMNYKYGCKQICGYSLVFDHNRITERDIRVYSEKAKEMWPVKQYYEDKALKFLALCNYDKYKALFYIEYNKGIFQKYINKEYQSEKIII